jgi:hypothetical protein
MSQETELLLNAPYLPESSNEPHERSMVFHVWPRKILSFHHEEIVRAQIAVFPFLVWGPQPGPPSRSFLHAAILQFEVNCQAHKRTAFRDSSVVPNA